MTRVPDGGTRESHSEPRTTRRPRRGTTDDVSIVPTPVVGDTPAEASRRPRRPLLDPDRYRLEGGQRDAPQWVEVVGRAGLVAYGLVHLGIAVLAVRIAALGDRHAADSRGAIALVAANGGFFGRWLLGASAVALTAFAVWQIRAALVGFRWAPDSERWRKRLGAAAKAIGVLSVAWLAVEFAARLQDRRSAFRTEVAEVFTLTGGRLLVGVAGLVAIGVAVAMTYTGVRATFMGDFVVDKVRGRRWHLAVITGRIGNLTRAVTFAVVGILTTTAAVTDVPDRIGGVDLALRTLAAHTVGATMLVVAAVGFACYFVYCVIDAYARHP